MLVSKLILISHLSYSTLYVLSKVFVLILATGNSTPELRKKINRIYNKPSIVIIKAIQDSRAKKTWNIKLKISKF